MKLARLARISLVLALVISSMVLPVHIVLAAAPSLTITSEVIPDVDTTTCAQTANITNLNGGGNVTERGFDYDDDGTGEPYTYNKHEHGSWSTGSYSLDLTSLSPDTTYYVRAYAINPDGTGTSSETTFHTPPTEVHFVGGSGNWSDDDNHWAQTTGGASSDGNLPGKSTDVYFDEHSNEPTDASYTITGDVGAYCHDIYLDNPASGLVTFNSGSTDIYGSLERESGAIWNTGSGTIYFYSTTTETITSNGGSYNSNFYFNGTGGTFTLQDNLTLTGYNVGLDIHAGTFDTNGKVVTCPSNVQIYGTLTLGTSVFTINTGQVFIFAGSILNLDSGSIYSYGGSWVVYGGTINCGTSTITLDNCCPSFTGYSNTYYNLVFKNSRAGQITGANTFHNLTIEGMDFADAFLYFSSNQIISGAFTLTGYSASHPLTVFSNSLHTQHTITAASVTATDTLFRDILGAGADDWDFHTQDDIGDCGGNTNIEFPVGINVYASNISGNVNWSNYLNWASSSNGTKGSGRVPLPQDIAVFDSHSMGINGIIVTFDVSYVSGINTVTVTKNPQFNATTEYFHNSINLGTCVWNVTSATWMMGQTIQTVSGDLSYGDGDLILELQGGSISLDGDLIVGDDLFLISGIFETTGYDVTAESFDSSSITYNRALWMGDSTFTLNDTAYSNKWCISASKLNIDSITSTIVFTNSGINTSVFIGGGFTYYDFTVEGAGDYTTTFADANTFHHFIVDRTEAHKTISGNYKQTITGILWWPEFGGTFISVNNTDFEDNSGYLISTDYIAFTGGDNTSVATGTSAPFYAGSHSTGSPQTGWNFSDPTGPTVTTVAATDVGETSATLNASLTLGQFTFGYLFFEYNKTGTFPAILEEPPTSYEVSDLELKNANGSYGIFVDGLDPEELYYFRACFLYNGGDYVYGSNLQIGTTGTPVIVTLDATNITSISATLNGSLTDLGLYDSADVYFQYGSTMSMTSETTPETKTEPVAFSAPILDLSAGHTYYFRAKVRYSEGIVINGDTLDFEATATQKPTPPDNNTTHTPTLGKGKTYITRLGPTLAGWLDSLGTLFGTDGKGIGGALTFIILVIIMLLLSRKGYPIAGLALGYPIQLGSAWVGLWDWAWVGVVTFLLAVVWIYKTWFEK